MAVNSIDKDEIISKQSKLTVIRRILSYLKPYKLKVSVIILFMLIVMACSILIPYLLEVAIDTYVANKDLAGLGKIGRNTLLINKDYGNMIWLGAVLTSLTLDGDPIVSYQACVPDCSLCIDKCPQNALDGIILDQKR